MKQEDKELLLKDLCARIPYGVKMNHIANSDIEPATLIGVAKYMITLEGNGGYSTENIEEFKPYLFPLSSMTEEQEMELDKLNPEFYSLICEDGSRYVSMDGNTFDWFNANHFDWRGLIPKGFALDATDKNIY